MASGKAVQPSASRWLQSLAGIRIGANRSIISVEPVSMTAINGVAKPKMTLSWSLVGSQNGAKASMDSGRLSQVAKRKAGRVARSPRGCKSQHQAPQQTAPAFWREWRQLTKCPAQ